MPGAEEPPPYEVLAALVASLRRGLAEMAGALRQPKDAPTFPRLGVAGDPRGAVDRHGASIEVDLVPPERPKFLVLSPVITDRTT